MFRPFDLIFLQSRFSLWWGGLRRKQAMVHGHAVTYWEGGCGETVLLIHGLNGSTLADFRRLSVALARSHHVISLDLPGFGLSTHVPIQQSVSNQAGFVRDFMEVLCLERAHVIGNSMGGWVALQLARRHPGMVHRLVLTAPAGIRFEHPPLEVFTPEDEEGLRRLLRHICYDPPRLPGWFLRDWLRVVQTRRGAVKEMLASMLTEEDLLDAHLSSMRLPTLILCGDSDRLIPPDTSRRMAVMMPGARLKMIERCGHLLLHEHHSMVLRHVEDFLKE